MGMGGGLKWIRIVQCQDSIYFILLYLLRSQTDWFGECEGAVYSISVWLASISVGIFKMFTVHSAIKQYSSDSYRRKYAEAYKSRSLNGTWFLKRKSTQKYIQNSNNYGSGASMNACDTFSGIVSKDERKKFTWNVEWMGLAINRWRWP